MAFISPGAQEVRYNKVIAPPSCLFQPVRSNSTTRSKGIFLSSDIQHTCTVRISIKRQEMKLPNSIVVLGLLSSPVKSFSSKGRAFASKMPSTDKKLQQTAKLWDWFANGYSKQPIKDEKAYQKKLQVTQSYLKPTDSVLEIGCGTGGTSIIHSSHVKKILATDISSKMLEIAKQKASGAGVKNVEFQRTSADELQLPKQSQNVVLGLSVLHLLDNKEEVMQKVHSWLKPGGLFVTSTICVGDMDATTKFFVKNVMPVGQFFGVIPKVYLFTKAELKESLRSSGFDIEYEWQPDKSDAAVFLIGKKK